MQGTLVMLLALSGMGCHHGGHARVYDACYDSCYAGAITSACYDSCYGGSYDACYGGGFTMGAYGACYDSGYSACYDACYSSCYDSCYGGKHGGKHGRGLFSCFKGLFGHKAKKHATYDACYSACYGPTYSACYDACYSSCYGGSYESVGYEMPVYGTYTPAVSPQSGYTSPQGVIMTTPGKAAPQGYGSGQMGSGQSTNVAPTAPPAQPSAPAADATETESFEPPVVPETETPPIGDLLDSPNT